MYNKPITQRVAAMRGKKSSALKQIEDTTVLNKEITVPNGEIPKVMDKSTKQLPGTTETVSTTKEDPKLTEFKKRCAKFGGKNSPEAAAAGCVWAEGAKDPAPITVQQTITKPGETVEAETPRWQYDYGDSMPSYMQRKVYRGLEVGSRRTGKFAKKAYDAMSTAERAKAVGIDIEKEGWEEKYNNLNIKNKRQFKKKAKAQADKAAFNAAEAFAETQMEAARQGQTFGKKGTTKIGTFDPNVRISGKPGTVGREQTMPDISTTEQAMQNQKVLQTQTAIEAAKNQEAANKRVEQTQTSDIISTDNLKTDETTSSPTTMKVGPLKMKSSFKMGGYGSKTYKK